MTAKTVRRVIRKTTTTVTDGNKTVVTEETVSSIDGDAQELDDIDMTKDLKDMFEAVEKWFKKS